VADPAMSNATAVQHACPVCGDGGRLTRLCVVDAFTIYACATCRAEHAWPMPTAPELKAFYDRPAWFEGGEKGGYADYDSQTAWSEGLVDSILDRFPDTRGRSILDLGCG